MIATLIIAWPWCFVKLAIAFVLSILPVAVNEDCLMCELGWHDLYYHELHNFYDSIISSDFEYRGCYKLPHLKFSSIHFCPRNPWNLSKATLYPSLLGPGRSFPVLVYKVRAQSVRGPHIHRREFVVISSITIQPIWFSRARLRKKYSY